MREIFVILIVILILLLLTAFKYRRQIRSLLAVSQMIREAKDEAIKMSKDQKETTRSVALVQCDKCGVWVPSDKALTVGGVKLCDKCVN